MLKNYKLGFGAIDMLIALVIVAAMFAFMMPALKGVGGGNLKDSSINYESAQEQVDKKINEIENFRQQTVQYNQKTNNDEY